MVEVQQQSLAAVEEAKTEKVVIDECWPAGGRQC